MVFLIAPVCCHGLSDLEKQNPDCDPQNVYPNPTSGAGFECRPPPSSLTRTLAVSTSLETFGIGRILTPIEALSTL